MLVSALGPSGSLGYGLMFSSDISSGVAAAIPRVSERTAHMISFAAIFIFFTCIPLGWKCLLALLTEHLCSKLEHIQELKSWLPLRFSNYFKYLSTEQQHFQHATYSPLREHYRKNMQPDNYESSTPTSTPTLPPDSTPIPYNSTDVLLSDSTQLAIIVVTVAVSAAVIVSLLLYIKRLKSK